MDTPDKAIIQATEAISRTAINTLLWWIYTMGAATQTRTMRDAYNAFQTVDDTFQRYNYDTFKIALRGLKQKGYIKTKYKGTLSEVLVTIEGRQRLEELAPTYKKKRSWDTYVYLVSYDIAEIYKKKRDNFRQYIRRIGCGLLQESLWVTPYNPRTLIDEFVRENDIEGMVLVSKLGKDGAIGDENLRQLLERVYHLTKLNEEYSDFIQLAKSKSTTPFQLSIRFTSILSHDPQLPFTLLPDDWLGDQAFKLIEKR